MIRNQYSYWLDIKGENVPRAIDLMHEDGTLAGGPVGVYHAEFHVAEHIGTIEEWPDMENVLQHISRQCPNTVFSMLAINEETEAEQRVVYDSGECIRNTYSRQVGADDKCDKKTAEDIITFLKERGHVNAANLVKAVFVD